MVGLGTGWLRRCWWAVYFGRNLCLSSHSLKTLRITSDRDGASPFGQFAIAVSIASNASRSRRTATVSGLTRPRGRPRFFCTEIS